MRVRFELDMSVITEELLSRRHRVTVREYYRMAELGLLADARVELVAGEVIDMTPTGPSHGGSTNFLDYALKQAVGGRALVRVQLPVRLDEHNEPEPDLAVVKPRTDFYKGAHPVAADVMLLVEVSDSTLRYDREVKAPLYALHGVPEVWIVDLKAESMHIYRSAAAGGYSDVSSTRAPAALTIAALPGVTVDLSQLFPR
jgi:Uma2 family endonuclease